MTVTLTAAETHALKVTFGADADIQAKAQQWIHDWCVQFTRQVKEDERVIKTRLWFLKPGQELFYSAADYSSGYLMRVVQMVEEESGHRFSSYTNLCGTMIRCNSVKERT